MLDVATGTGLAAQAALDLVGPNGSVAATDVSPAMVEQARTRLSGAGNVSVSVEDAQSLSFPDKSFDAVICSLGLMFFPNPKQALSEFYRVLRPSGRAAVSVLTSPERSYNGRINIIIAPHAPAFADTVKRTFALGSETRLRTHFEEAGFREFLVTTKAHRFTLPSFDAYFGPFERGGGSTGQVYIGLSEDVRIKVRKELQRSVGDTGGPVNIDVEFGFASGVRT